MKKEIITICGSLGSGKSSAAKKVAQILSYKHFSSGDFFRQVGFELGFSVTETNIRAETDPKIDEMTDQKMRDLNNDQKKLSLIHAWHFTGFRNLLKFI